MSDVLKNQLLKYCDTLGVWARDIPDQSPRDEMLALSVELAHRIDAIANCNDSRTRKEQLRDLRFCLLSVNPKCFELHELYDEVSCIGALESENIQVVCSIEREYRFS